MDYTKADVNIDSLRRFMDAKGFTEYRLAKEIGVSYPQIYRIMNGDRKPGAKVIIGLMGLGLSPSDIFIMPDSLTEGNGNA